MIDSDDEAGQTASFPPREVTAGKIQYLMAHLKIIAAAAARKSSLNEIAETANTSERLAEPLLTQACRAVGLGDSQWGELGAAYRLHDEERRGTRGIGSIKQGDSFLARHRDDPPPYRPPPYKSPKPGPEAKEGQQDAEENFDLSSHIGEVITAMQYVKTLTDPVYRLILDMLLAGRRDFEVMSQDPRFGGLNIASVLGSMQRYSGISRFTELPASEAKKLRLAILCHAARRVRDEMAPLGPGPDTSPPKPSGGSQRPGVPMSESELREEVLKLFSPAELQKIGERARLLTPRERVVLDGVLAKKTVGTIATEMGIVKGQASNYLSRVYQKMEVPTFADHPLHNKLKRVTAREAMRLAPT